MGARIIQVDLAQPLPTLQTSTGDCRRSSGGGGGAGGGGATANAPIWILAMLGPQPLGWVRCDDPKKFGKQIGPDQLLKLANDALSREIQAAAREHAHEPITLTRTPTFSIIICTPRGCEPGALERQLRSIAEIKYPAVGYEVIVVGDSNVAARAVCEKFAFARYAYDPRPGVNYARNTGWQLARYEIVAYLDAGAIIDPDWLNALATNHADAQADCVTGVALPREIETPAQEQLELHLSSTRKLRRRVYRAGTWNTTFPLDASRFGGGTAATLSICRTALETAGGFDVALNGDGGVFDVLVRVLRDGGAVVHDPRAIVFRGYPRSPRALRWELLNAACGFVACCTKHAYDLELGNHAAPLRGRWLGRRLLGLIRGRHLSRDIACAELLGGVIGLHAYARAVRRVRTQQASFARRDMTPAEVPLRPPAPEPKPAPARARARSRRAAAA